MKVDPVKQYAQAVLKGKIKAGRLVRLACERHLRDLKNAKRLKLHFDLDAALYYINFIETFCVLAEGQHAGEPFKLKLWQKFIVGSLFGWKTLDGFRRFRRAYIETPKGAGKTPTGAAIVICMLLADGEPAAELYAAGATKNQAEVCYRDVKLMLEKAPDLAAEVDIGVANIAYHSSDSFFRPISAEGRSLDGKRVHFAVIDELHQHRTNVVLTKIIYGMKGRSQPMVMVLTNSGSDPTSPVGEEHDAEVRILEGIVKDESHFSYITGLDACKAHRTEGKFEPQDGCKDCDQWTDERAWIKANPNIGQSIPYRYLRDQVRNALNIPSQINEVKRVNFNIWTQQHTRWLSPEDWRACRAKIDLATLKGRPCYVGIDLAQKIDFAAMVLLFPPAVVPTKPRQPDEAQSGARPAADAKTDLLPTIDLEKLSGPYIALPYFWMPEARCLELAQQDRLPYDRWVKEGYIETIPGNAIDDDYIRDRLLALNNVFHFKVIGYDPAHAWTFALKLVNEYHLPMLEVGQGASGLSEPTKELQRLIITKHFQHPDNLLFNAMASNATVKEDRRRRFHLEKPSKTKKIDGVVATVIALFSQLRNPDLRSVYEGRGVRAI